MPPITDKIYKISFGGHAWLLDPAGALYWPSESILIVSDLHLEKGSFFTQFGAMLPQYDTRDTLTKLATLIEKYRPATVVCLGDSFHDRNAYARLHEEDKAQLVKLCKSVDIWNWVLGNHDPALPEELPGHIHPRLEIKNVVLAHEPEIEGMPQIVGHFHPKVTFRLGGHRVSGPAFIHDNALMILPSFGSFTGGLDVMHEAIAARLTAPNHYLIYRGQIWQKPINKL